MPPFVKRENEQEGFGIIENCSFSFVFSFTGFTWLAMKHDGYLDGRENFGRMWNMKGDRV